MHFPIEDLTPREIVARLDEYIVGQNAAKKAVAVALRNRYRRQKVDEKYRDDILPKNILMMGPTGVGKTEIARRLAQLARAPFIKVEATKFTEVGYVGRDVDSMIRDLAAMSVRLVEKERMETVKDEAERKALDRLAELVLDTQPQDVVAVSSFDIWNPSSEEFDPEAFENGRKLREEKLTEIRAELVQGKHADVEVEVSVEEANNPFMQVFSNQGIEEMGIDTSIPGGPFGSRTSYRKVTVVEAHGLLFEEEAKRLLDRATIHREAVLRAEQTGIIFIDEIDKVAGKNGGSGPDVSREGVQRDLLPVIEGSTVPTKFGPVRTDHILFIAAGAFHLSKPSDLIPELQGRLPIRVVLESLKMDDFKRILREPKNALTRQYEMLLAADGITFSFTDDALDELAVMAAAVNEKIENIGARRLHTMMEKLLEELAYLAPEIEPKAFVFDRSKVREILGPYVDDPALGREML